MRRLKEETVVNQTFFKKGSGEPTVNASYNSQAEEGKKYTLSISKEEVNEDSTVGFPETSSASTMYELADLNEMDRILQLSGVKPEVRSQVIAQFTSSAGQVDQLSPANEGWIDTDAPPGVSEYEWEGPEGAVDMNFGDNDIINDDIRYPIVKENMGMRKWINQIENLHGSIEKMYENKGSTYNTRIFESSNMLTESKELFMAAHEEAIEEYLAAHPEASEEEAYDATADIAYKRMLDNAADMADYAKDRYRDDQMVMDESSNNIDKIFKLEHKKAIAEFRKANPTISESVAYNRTADVAYKRMLKKVKLSEATFDYVNQADELEGKNRIVNDFGDNPLSEYDETSSSPKTMRDFLNTIDGIEPYMDFSDPSNEPRREFGDSDYPNFEVDECDYGDPVDHFEDEYSYTGKPESSGSELRITNKYADNPLVRESYDDSEDNFYDGQKVKLAPEYADRDPDEIFTLSQWDGRKGWISDEMGRGWYVRGYQIVPAENEGYDYDNDDFTESKINEKKGVEGQTGGDRVTDKMVDKLDRKGKDEKSTSGKETDAPKDKYADMAKKRGIKETTILENDANYSKSFSKLLEGFQDEVSDEPSTMALVDKAMRVIQSITDYRQVDSAFKFINQVKNEFDRREVDAEEGDGAADYYGIIESLKDELKKKIASLSDNSYSNLKYDFGVTESQIRDEYKAFLLESKKKANLTEGAWGYGPFDNDYFMDEFHDLYTKYVGKKGKNWEEGLVKNKEVAEKIANGLNSDIVNLVRLCKDDEHNVRGIIGLYRSAGVKPSNEAAKKLSTFISNILSSDWPDTWDNSKSIKKSLQDDLKFLGQSKVEEAFGKRPNNPEWWLKIRGKVAEAQRFIGRNVDEIIKWIKENLANEIQGISEKELESVVKLELPKLNQVGNVGESKLKEAVRDERGKIFKSWREATDDFVFNYFDFEEPTRDEVLKAALEYLRRNDRQNSENHHLDIANDIADSFNYTTMDELNEVLSCDDDAGEWIKDFQDSKNPKFKGKSKEERKNQALGAYYGKCKESISESVPFDQDIVRQIATEIKILGFRPFIEDSSRYGALLRVSAEEGDGAADYYGEFRDEEPWINPKLEALADKYGCFWEWENPGVILLYRLNESLLVKSVRLAEQTLSKMNEFDKNKLTKKLLK